MTRKIRVVLDTNVYISGLLFGGGPAEILRKVVAGSFELCISPAIREEVESTLRQKFGWSVEDIEIGCSPLWTVAHCVSPQETLTVVAADPDDDRILECAVTADADLVVTGDDHLLELTDEDLREIPLRRLQILTVRAFRETL